MEPWAAQGSFVGTIEPGTRTPDVTGPVLRAEHTRFVLPIWSAAGSQYVVPQAAANALALILPGIPEANMAYEVTPGGVDPLRVVRVAGGMQVTFDEFGLTTQVLLAQDRRIVNDVRRRAMALGRRAAQLHRNIAVRELNSVQTLSGQLASRLPVPPAPQWLQSARKSLQACETHLKSNDNIAATKDADRAMRSLRLIERAYWDAAAKPLVSPVASPGAVGFETLSWHLRLVDRLNPRAGHMFGPNRVAGGDFEDLDTMMRAGWRYIQHAPPAVQTAVDLAPDAARSGRLGLRLAAVAVNPKNPPAVVESPPVLFTSPPIQVEAGQVVCVYGWVQVPAPITGSVDGLLIVDSLAGEALADRIGQTDGWRRFALYRVAPQSGPMCVTFALSGIGEALLDDVAIQVLQ